MKPAPFEYVRAENADHISALLTEYGEDARLLAGGQSLVPMLAMRLLQPRVLIDINDIDGMDAISHSGNSIEIGAGIRQAKLMSDRNIAHRFPLLPAMLAHVGHQQTRNRGTLGGSLAHADPAAELPLAAMVLNAEIVATKSGGNRSIPAQGFFVDALETGLDATEWISRIRFPDPTADSPARAAFKSFAFEEMAQRQSDFAIAASAVTMSADKDGICTESAIALSGAASVPLRMIELEHRLVGSDVTSASFGKQIRDWIKDSLAPITPPEDQHADSRYRLRLLHGLLFRTLSKAIKNTCEAIDAKEP